MKTMSAYKWWTSAELERFKKLYPILPMSELEQRFDRSRSALKNTAHKYGLRKEVVNYGAFKPGHTPWNKGIRYDCEGSKATRFKPGNLPHNTRFDGAIRIEHKAGENPYKQIRIAKGKWVPLHRLRFEECNGEIPKGMILRCIDGDTLNCDPSNWKMLTRAENCKLNTNRAKQSEGLKRSWRRKHLREIYGLTRDQLFG